MSDLVAEPTVLGKLAQLHVHTEYSLLDAMNKVKELIARAKELNLYAIAITDHGNVFGAAEFAQQADKAGVKYIIGCEVYIHPEGKEVKTRDNRHLVLLAKNETGYKNLITIVSDASINGFYYNPRTDYEMLKQHSEGLIALSACLGGDVSREISHNVGAQDSNWMAGYKAGLEKALFYKEIFGEDFYLEIQDNLIEDQYKLNNVLIRISEDTGIKLVATNDAHYLRKENFSDHDALMALGAGTHVGDTKRKIYGSDDFYLKSYDDMLMRGKIPIEAVENTIEIADKCNFKFEFGKYKIPSFKKIPPVFRNSVEYLKYLSDKGLRERYPDDWENRLERLSYEIGVIEQMGFVDYFLIVWDFVKYAIEHGYFYGPGRGSGAGSLLSNTLYITHLDPIKYALLFERFLNPSRISMPDEHKTSPDIEMYQRKSRERYCLAVWSLTA